MKPGVCSILITATAAGRSEGDVEGAPDGDAVALGDGLAVGEGSAGEGVGEGVGVGATPEQAATNTTPIRAKRRLDGRMSPRRQPNDMVPDMARRRPKPPPRLRLLSRSVRVLDVLDDAETGTLRI